MEIDVTERSQGGKGKRSETLLIMCFPFCHRDPAFCSVAFQAVFVQRNSTMYISTAGVFYSTYEPQPPSLISLKDSSHIVHGT